MNKQILSVMVAGSMLAVSTVGLAQAQTSIPGDTQQQTTSQQYSSQTFGTTAPNQFGPSNTIVVGSSQMPPAQSVSTGQATLITVMNPSPNPVTFTVPALNANYEIAPNSQRVVQITPDMVAALPAGQEVAYYITDASGNQIASSTITRDEQIAYTFTQQSAVTQQAQEVEVEQQPTATTETQDATTRRSTVRGYW